MTSKLLKRIITFAILLIAFSIVLGVTAFAIENEKAKYVMDAERMVSGHLGILYVKGGTSSSGVVSGGTLYFGMYDPTLENWTEVPVGETAPIAKEAALAIDSSGIRHVAYVTSDNKIAYTHTEGTGWSEPVIIESADANGTRVSSDALSCVDIAVDSNDKVYIAYIDTDGAGDDESRQPDGMCVTNATGEFVKSVVYSGTGYREGYGMYTWTILRPIKVALKGDVPVFSYKEYVVDSTSGTSGTFKDYYLNFKEGNNDPINIHTNSGGFIHESIVDNAHFYSLVNNGGSYYVVDGNALVDGTSTENSMISADMTIANSKIYYAGIDGTDLLFYQDGTFIDDKSAETAILSSHNKCATVLDTAGNQYIIYTGNDDNKSLVILTIKDDEVDEFIVPNYCQVGFDPDNGETAIFSSAEEGASITLPSADSFTAPVGTKFAGWKLDDTVYNAGASFTVESDVTFVAQWDTIIYSANCTITKPIGGQTPDMNPVSAESSKYSVELDNIYLYEDPYPDLTSSDEYVAGSQYAFRIVFTEEDGYVFDDDVVFTINGNETSSYGAQGLREVCYTAQTLISTVTVSNDILPVGGATPNFDLVSTFEGYTISSDVVWKDYSNSNSIMTDSDTFVAGNTYKVEVCFVPNEGYVFDDLANMTATIDGVSEDDYSTEIFTAGGEPYLNRTVYYTFTDIPEPITSHKVTFMVADEVYASGDVDIGGTAASLKPENPTPYKEYLTFVAWYLNDQEYNFDSEVTEDITLKAAWNISATAYAEPQDAGIVYAGNNPEGATYEVSETWNFVSGDSAGFQKQANEGYRFKEWRIGSPSGEVVTNDGDIHLDGSTTNLQFTMKDDYDFSLTFYAIFEIEPVTSISGDKTSVDFGSIRSNFTVDERDEIKQTVRITNKGNTTVKVTLQNPDSNIFARYDFGEGVLEPEEYIDVDLILSTGSWAVQEYNGTYTFTATNVNDDEDTDTFTVGATVNITAAQCTITTDLNGGTNAGWPMEQTTNLGSSISCNSSLISLINAGVHAPDGYEFDCLEIDGTRYELGSSYQVNGDVTIKLLWKEKTYIIRVNTVDVADGEQIEGTLVCILSGDTTLESFYSNNETHVKEGMKAGEYTLEVAEVTNGYMFPAPITFTINSDGSIVSTGSTTEDDEGNVVLLLELEKTSVDILVKDVETYSALEGVTIQILDSEGNVIDEWVSTDEEHTISGLVLTNEYTIRITTLSSMYKNPGDKAFTIAEDGTITTTASLDGDTIVIYVFSKYLPDIQSFVSSTDDEIKLEDHGSFYGVVYDDEKSILENHDDLEELLNEVVVGRLLSNNVDVVIESALRRGDLCDANVVTAINGNLVTIEGSTLNGDYDLAAEYNQNDLINILVTAEVDDDSRVAFNSATLNGISLRVDGLEVGSRIVVDEDTGFIYVVNIEGVGVEDEIDDEGYVTIHVEPTEDLIWRIKDGDVVTEDLELHVDFWLDYANDDVDGPGLIRVDLDDNDVYNVYNLENKLLFTLTESNEDLIVTLADGVSSGDNIIYDITDNDRVFIEELASYKTAQLIFDVEETSETTYSLTVNTTGDGNVGYIKNSGTPTEFHNQIIDNQVKANDKYVLQAKANSGNKFVRWTKDGNNYSTSAKITVTITGDVEYKAVFEVKSTSTHSSGGGGSTTSKYKITTKMENGKILPSNPTLEKNESEEFTFKANEGYEITDVLVDGKSVGVVNSYTLEDVKEKHTIEVKTSKKSILSNVDDWAKAEMSKADEMGLVPETFKGKDATTEISRTDFAAVAVKLYEALAHKEAEIASTNPFTDTNDSYVLKAYNLGITMGISETEFGNGTITREQMATMIDRALKKAGIIITVDLETVEKFADDYEMSAWGRPSIYAMAKEGIIKGVGDNKYNPLGNAKVEEALAISLRCIETLRK